MSAAQANKDMWRPWWLHSVLETTFQETIPTPTLSFSNIIVI
jgi:hypothetical protein